MNKLKKGKKFSREAGQRKALIKSIVAQLFLNQKIRTTETRAKEARRFAEKYLTRAKKGDLGARRYLSRFFQKDLVKKIVDEIAPKFKGRNGGYTRIIKIKKRVSDGAKIAQIELLEK